MIESVGKDVESKDVDQLLITAVSMIFANMEDMVTAASMILEAEADTSEVSNFLRASACSALNLSRLVVRAMPNHARDRLDEIWSAAAAERAKIAAVKQKQGQSVN